MADSRAAEEMDDWADAGRPRQGSPPLEPTPYSSEEISRDGEFVASLDTTIASDVVAVFHTRSSVTGEETLPWAYL
jgi:hypothetical protein